MIEIIDNHLCEKNVILKSGATARFLRSESEPFHLTIKLPYSGVYGMGEKYNSLNQKGKRVVNQVVEKFCYQGENTYMPSPFFVTDTGLGIYIETTQKTEFVFEEDILCIIPENTRVYIFTGSLREIIAEYMGILGEPVMIPKYALGVWISANHWDSQKKVEEQLALIQKYEYPVNVMVLEAWSDEATFYIWNEAEYEKKPGDQPFHYDEFSFRKEGRWYDPKDMIEKLHGMGIRLVLWQIPVYKEEEETDKNPQLEEDKKTAIESGLCVMNKDGMPYRIPEENWFAGSYIPDFTNPLTKEIWFSKRKYLLGMGVDGFKTDGGEFIYSDDIRLFNGIEDKAVKNIYAQQYIEAYSEFIDDANCLFSRAGYAGAHRTPIHWAGDQQSTNKEMKNALTAGLSAAMTGVIFWGFDIAGFAGPLPTMDLYRRATMMGCFSPIIQWHSEPDGGQFKEIMPGGEGNNERSPWNLAKAYASPDFIHEMQYWSNLRMNLIPYLYSTAVTCVEMHQPMLRPFIYEWPEDPRVIDIEDEYLLGENLLIAPLLEENAVFRELYLPDGNWFGLFSGKRYKGGACVTSENEKFPVFIKEGTAIALHTDKTNKLGSKVDNRVERITNLHFILAGEQGEYHYKDESADTIIMWNGNKVLCQPKIKSEMSWERYE